MTNICVQQENLRYLLREKYLADVDLGLLFNLFCFLVQGSNLIVKEEYLIGESPVPMPANISYLAREMEKSLSTISANMGQLIRKGIVLEVSDEKEVEKHGRVVSERALFVNPEIAYAGDYQRIGEKISWMAITNKAFGGKNLSLPYKVWIGRGDTYGRLVALDKFWELKYRQVEA